MFVSLGTKGINENLMFFVFNGPKYLIPLDLKFRINASSIAVFTSELK